MLTISTHLNYILLILINADHVEEEWRGKNLPCKSVPTSRRAKHTMLEPTVQLAGALLHLKDNGFTSHGKFTIRTSNTCPFDSVYAILAALYCDEPEIKNQIDALAPSSSFLKLICDTFSSDESLLKTYNSLMKARNLFLRDYFEPENAPKSFMHFECSGNVNLVIPKVSIFYFKNSFQYNVCSTSIFYYTGHSDRDILILAREALWFLRYEPTVTPLLP